MTQDFTDNCFAGGNVVQTDMQNIEDNFTTLKSAFSGSSAPSNLVAGLIWYKTTTYNGWRGYTGSAWEKILQGDANLKIWDYANTAPEGWRIDTSVTDVVLAFKGGSQAYNYNGGNVRGSWNMSGALSTANESSHTHSHNHQWYDSDGASADDNSYSSGGSSSTFESGVVTKNYPGGYSGLRLDVAAEDTAASFLGDKYTNNDATAGSAHSHSVSSDSTDRIRAAVGVMLYPELRT